MQDTGENHQRRRDNRTNLSVVVAAEAKENITSIFFGFIFISYNRHHVAMDLDKMVRYARMGSIGNQAVMPYGSLGP